MKYNTTWAPPGQYTGSGDLPPGSEMETAIPARPASFVADVVVPLVQSLVTGALLGGLAVFLLGELAPSWDVDPFKVWAGVALAISTLAWLVLLGQTRRLLWAVEKLTGQDLDGDRQVGKPQERVVIVGAGKAQEQAAQRENEQRASQFAQFVAGIPIKGTAIRSWESELGRDTYQEYRDALIRLGWARWNSTKKDGTPNETKGWALALPAAEILERISG